MAGEDNPFKSQKRISLTKRATISGIAAELLVLLETVTADGRIDNTEVGHLRTWLRDNGTSDLPGVEFLRTTVAEILVDGKVTADERIALYKAVERVLPPEARRRARERRTAVTGIEKERARAEKIVSAAIKREQRERMRPIASANFMLAGVSHEGRADVIARYASDSDRVYLAREPENPYDPNAIRVLLGNGFDIGFVPRENAADLAPTLDAGCKQLAYLTKILQGKRFRIPVVQVHFYRSDVSVAGAVCSHEVPRRVIVEQSSDLDASDVLRGERGALWADRLSGKPSGQKRSGCLGCFTELFVGTAAAVSILILASQ